MKLKIFLVVLVLTLVFCVSGHALAQGMTDAQRQALIAQIQQEIAQLTAQLNQMLAEQQGTQGWCYTFNNNLGYANSGSIEVANLHIALQKQGISYSPDDINTYSTGTSQAVIVFQERYASDILAPVGLTHGTGFVGISTRAQLNQLYGCSSSNPSTTNCTPNYRQGCYNNSVYNYDSCGNRGSLALTCSSSQTCSNGSCSNPLTNNCVQNYQQKCYNNSVYNYDSCGNMGSLVQACLSNQTCSNGSCVTNTTTNCTPNYQQKCYNGSVYNYDSCGVLGSLVQICSSGCSNGSCTSSSTNNTNNCLAACVPQSGLMYPVDCYGNVGTACSSNQICQKTYNTTNTYNPTTGTIQTNSTLTGAQCTTPTPVLTKINITPPSSTSLTIGQTLTLSATSYDQNGNSMYSSTIAWTSSNTSVATVSSYGTVTAVAPGTTNITASSGSLTSPTLTITVTTAPVNTCKADCVTVSNVTYAITNCDGTTATPCSSSQVCEKTYITTYPVVNGLPTVVKTLTGAQCTTPTPVLTKINITPPSSTSLTIGQTLTLSATSYDQNGNSMYNSVTWRSSNTSVATVSSYGTVTALAPGTTSITASSGSVASTALAITVTTIPACTSWTYSGWSVCSQSGNQTRTVLTSSPSGCTGGNPITSQSCTPSCTTAKDCQDFYKDCYRTCSNNSCSGHLDTFVSMGTYPNCISACVPNWTCADYGTCQYTFSSNFTVTGGQQTRTCTDSQNCGVKTNEPPLTQSCTPAATAPSSGFHGFIYNTSAGPSSYITLDMPGATETHPEAVYGNNIVGYYNDSYYADKPGQAQGFLFDGTNWTTINYPGATGTYPEGISGNNVVGFYYGSFTNSRGFIYNIASKTWTAIDMPGAFSTGPEGIDGSTVVGSYIDLHGTVHGFLYDLTTASYTALDFPSAQGVGAGLPMIYNGTHIEGVYHNGQILVGFYYDGTTIQRGKGLIKDSSGWHDLSLGASQTYPRAGYGNNVIGWASGGGGSSPYGFLYNVGVNWSPFGVPGSTATYPRGISGNIITGWFQQP